MTGFEDAFIIFVPTVFSDFPIMNRYCLDTTEKEKYYEFQLLTKRKVDHRQLVVQVGNAKEQNGSKWAGNTKQMQDSTIVRKKIN